MEKSLAVSQNIKYIVIMLLLLLLSRFSRVRLCDSIDGSPPGSPIPGILQARTLEWVAISFSNASKWKVKVKLLSRVRLLATSWTAAYQAPPSMGFSRQGYWSGVPLPFLLGDSKSNQTWPPPGFYPNDGVRQVKQYPQANCNDFCKSGGLKGAWERNV